MPWQRVCATSDLSENEMKAFPLAPGAEILIVRSGADFFAYPPFCPHEQAELAFGTCDGALITCMQHLWQWDLRTGAPAGLAEIPLEPYAVRVTGEDVLVQTDE